MSRTFVASLALAALVSLSAPATAQLRITEVITSPTSGDQIVEVTNVGGSSQTLSTVQLCQQFAYSGLPAVPVAAGASVRLHWNATGTNTVTDVFTGPAMPPLNAANDSIGLYVPGGGLGFFGNPANIVDFVQWGAGNQPRATTAVAAGLWPDVNDFPAAPGSGCSLSLDDGLGLGGASWFQDASPTPGESNQTATSDTTSIGTGCSVTTPPVLSATSVAALGNKDWGLAVSSDQASSPAALFIGIGLTTVPILGGACDFHVAVPILDLGLATNGSGDILLPLGAPDDITLVGIQLGFQVLVANTDASLKFDVSNGLGVTF